MASIKLKSLTSPENPVYIRWERRHIRKAFPSHWHDNMEIQFVKEGIGCYFFEGAAVSFRRNSVIVIQPHEIHRLAHSKGMVEKWCLLFNIRSMGWPSHFLREITALKRSTGLRADESESIEQIFCKIMQENKERQPCWQAIVSALLTELLLRVKRSESETAPNLMRPVVTRALDYIEQNYRSPFNVGALAKLLNISERHLFRLFEADIGMPIKHYVLQRRVLHAQRLIRSNPAIKLEAVSEEVGFTQYSLFHRIFKKFTGLPPRAHGRI